LIEGIGRPRVEPSFLFDVVDEVDDTTSIAGVCLLRELFGFRHGGSSGTNLAACLQLAARMRERGERGSVVSLLGDRGERYEQTLFDRAWLETHGIDPNPAIDALRRCVQDGRWALASIANA
jgi:cysteine synthase A